ncbi:Serine/threonine-protein kinase PrkC [Enhygromyxa salina]|uniref:Serine/threonine-protein kinase PrkC n=1 Tax=Enhygromyxa salina TaxID=215803 RepID=A0A2S9YGQ3_9BACT|nr:serine/threonine-protein kinase [Enhygromyxa salina]PRQ04295.1 Serine/threonine-protein kinase PrkC [Enhygromyxa salina]
MSTRDQRSPSSSKLAQLFAELNTESRHGRRWQQLIDRVWEAAGARQFDPSQPGPEIGRFEALRVRGMGGFGVVFEVRDPELDRRVALKLCVTPSPKAADALMAEAKVLAGLSHPNIVTVHEPGRHGDDVFFVMEYMEGPNGHEYGQGQPSPSWGEIVDVYRGAGRGLAAAHDAGVVHGDFKPANILLDARGRARVADFGLARKMIEHAPAAEQQGLRHRPGTLPYMAPELLRGEAGGPQADQWAFCVALWETLDRSLPFEGPRSGELLDAVERGLPDPRNLDVPEALRELLRVGLALDPSARHPNMHALVRELDRLREPSSPELTPDPARPQHRAAALGRGAFLAALLVAGGAVFGSLSSRQASPPAPVELAREAARASELQPEFGCAYWDLDARSPEPDEKLRGVCSLIRLGHFDEASAIWGVIHGVRNHSPAATGIEGYTRWDLAVDTLVVAQTFLAEAETRQLKGNSASAIAAANESAWWAAAAGDLVTTIRDGQHNSTNNSLKEKEDASSALREAHERIANITARADQLTGDG